MEGFGYQIGGVHWERWVVGRLEDEGGGQGKRFVGGLRE